MVSRDAVLPVAFLFYFYSIFIAPAGKADTD
jgi:hypothetical protein